ncbi:MAG: sulfatase [Cytophagales bacterium]|jgi:arylsulfatase A-like enzyme|nr:sulfatase [Cytophagales bacterium]
MRPFFLLFGVCWFLFCELGQAQNAVQPDRPNVVLVLCDDLNDAVGLLGGHPQVRTPNIDRLMRRGVRFVNAGTNSPICAPSRASLLTGLHPHTSGYFGYNQQANHFRQNPVLRNAVTFIEHLRDNGYRVFGTGKVFHNGHEDRSVWHNKDGRNGFGVEPHLGPFPWDGLTRRNNEAAGEPEWMALPQFPKEMQTSWETSFGPLSEPVDFARHDSVPRDHSKQGWTSFGKPYRYVSDTDRDPLPDELNTRFALDVLGQKHEQPFFLAVGYNKPHTAMYAPNRFFDLFPLETVQLPPIRPDDLTDCAPLLTSGELPYQSWGFSRFKLFGRNSGDAQKREMLRRWVQAYLACTAFVDEEVGKLLAGLEASPYARNTMVIFASDNGYHLGEKQYVFKYTLWEESNRIPLAVSGPGIPADRVCQRPVSLIDLYPTLVDYCRLPANPNANTNRKPLEGHSLRPLLEHPDRKQWNGPEGSLSVVAGVEKLAVNEPGQPEKQHYTVRTERYRYIRCANGEEELYDHKTDPNEWTNLAGQPRYRELKIRLQRLMPNAQK